MKRIFNYFRALIITFLLFACSPDPNTQAYIEHEIVISETNTVVQIQIPTMIFTPPPKETNTLLPSPSFTKAPEPTNTIAPFTPLPIEPTQINQTFGCPDGCTSQISGCNIKGNISINTSEKIYHLPGMEYYNETIIRPEYGERWFCTEQEAIANGWRKAKTN